MKNKLVISAKLVPTEGGFIALSPKDGNYYHLDEGCMQIIHGIEDGYDLTDIVRLISQQYSMNYNSVYRDYSEALSNLKKTRNTEGCTMSSPIAMEPRVRLSMSKKMYAKLIVLFAYLITLMKPQQIQRILFLFSRHCDKATYIEASEWRTAVNTVSPRCAGNGCLLRSVSVMLWGITKRKTPEWVSGIRVRPFVAHAWVEVEHVPVDEPEDIQTYQEVLSVRRENR